MVKFHNRGTGKGSGPVGYLLGQDGQREGATLLRGDPATTVELIDSLSFAKKYTSGVLSFAEADLSPRLKDQLMTSFERALVPGLDGDQYQCLWVEHQDKGRLELNFVVPNVELTSGKRLQPYYDKADRPRINAWQTLANSTLDLHDPNDPKNRQALTMPSDLPRATQEAAKAITAGLMGMAESGLISSREDVLNALQEGGFKIARETKSSISIENPGGGRNIRLKGALYERDFRLGQEFRAEIEAASQRYRESAQERIQEARTFYQRGLELKRADNQRRYQRPERTANDLVPQGVGMDGPQHTADIHRQRRGPLVNRSADRIELDRDREAGPDVAADRGQNVRPSVEGGSEGPVHHPAPRLQGGGRLDSGRAASLEIGEGVEHDRARTTALERIRDITERVRETAAGMASSLREFADHVRENIRGNSGLEAAGERLNDASRTLEQAALERSNQRDRGLDLGM